MSVYAKADTRAQWFADRYPGSRFVPNCGVLHTTEGATWPTYSGGAVAPNVTARPDVPAKVVRWRAHFPDEMSARALQNLPGGVDTNTACAVQVELVGTCDARHRVSWPGVGKAGVDYIYWPEAPEWCLNAVADFVADQNRRHGIPIDGPAVWLSYGPDPRRPGVSPAAYGASPARMSFAQWRAFKGWCGHQHVPEQDHGDPGALPWDSIAARARALVGQVDRPAVTGPRTRGEAVDAALAAAKRIKGTGKRAKVRARVVKLLSSIPYLKD